MQTWQNSAIIVWIIKIVIALLAALVFGNGSVVAFNHLPEKWFEDWVKEGDDDVRRLPKALIEADNSMRQRIPSNPWKWVFAGLFGVSGIYLGITSSIQYQISVLIVMVIVLGMAISDQLYKIVPDQFQLMLAISAVGFVTYNENWWEPIAGAGIGLAICLAEIGLGSLIFKKDAIGGADIKFYTCMGLVAGRRGIIVIFILTTILFAIQSIFKIATGKGTIKDSNAMMPAAFVATMIYLLFLWNLTDMIQL